jgi:hypothetical protein
MQTPCKVKQLFYTPDSFIASPLHDLFHHIAKPGSHIQVLPITIRVIESSQQLSTIHNTVHSRHSTDDAHIMADIPEKFTATVVFGYAWSINEATKQILSYTKTYTNSPGTYKLYDVVVNTALPSPLRFETVGIDFTMMAPGGRIAHPTLATVATSRPFLRNLHDSTAQVTPVATASSTVVRETSSTEVQLPSQATVALSSFVWRPNELSNVAMYIICLVVLMIMGLVRLRKRRKMAMQHGLPKC